MHNLLVLTTYALMKIQKITCLFLTLLFSDLVQGQKPGNGLYGSEWLAGKYEQPWLRIGVSQKGLQKLTLPTTFQNKQTQLHLYHRGLEVSLIGATSTEIEFYATPNDGASDMYLYRPYTGVRQNPHYSWFSDESSYFLTYSSLPSKLAITQKETAISGVVEQYHLQTDLTKYTTSDTYDGGQNYVYHSLDQSFFSEGKGRSGKAVFKILQDTVSTGNPIFAFPFQLQNAVVDQSRQPTIQVQLNGRTFAKNSIKAAVGKTSTTLSNYADLISFADFSVFNREFKIRASKELDKSDVDANGNSYFKLESVNVTNDYSSTGIFSVNFVKVIYPQGFDMAGLTSKTFNLLPTTSGYSNLSIVNSPANARVYDISDIDNPRIIKASYTGNTLQVMVERISGKELNLLVTSESKGVVAANVSTVSFKNYSPSDNDFLIITNETLMSASQTYAEYRRSEKGGNHRTLVVSIKDIYNQFNYGEPSPIAIRRFVDFMLSKGIREKHNLLLVGISTTLWNQMSRELPEEIPTIGFPGSDILLVEGLAGVATDVPAIPIGRISATTVSQVLNYLNKVKTFESNDDLSWNKKILHLSGGKSSEEIKQLAGMLSNLIPIAETGQIGGQVTTFVKKSAIEVEDVDITPEVNAGVGMITYCGHGSSTTTDFDLGYISDPKRGYNNFSKFPLIYFNGCGVANIFNGRNNTNITSGNKLPLSSDWINSEKGSIAIIANSYYSFVSSSTRYLGELYNQLFTTSTAASISIGQIQKSVAKSIVTGSHNEYDIANIHQSLLQGDPALNLIKVEGLDYSIQKAEGLHIYANTKGKVIGDASSLKIGAVVANKGKFLKNQAIPLKITFTYKDGSVKSESFTHAAISFRDTVYYEKPNDKPIQKIMFIIDPDNTLPDIVRDNNSSELLVNWDEAKNLTNYPIGNTKDIIKPILSVTFNEESPKNGQIYRSAPSIAIRLVDDKFLTRDTTLINLYIKPCDDELCDFERENYAAGMSLTQNAEGNLILNYLPTNMKNGKYEILVSAKDTAGNVVLNSYRIKFQIDNEMTLKMNLVASPNPFSGYVRFDLQNPVPEIVSVNLNVFDNFGRVVYNKEEDGNSSTYYWQPGQDQKGLYVYKIIVVNSKGEKNIFSGKLMRL